MIAFKSPSEIQKQLVQNVRSQRLKMNLTQEGLSKRSGVPLPTLRKFEQQGTISLESFLKIEMVLGGLEKILKATEVNQESFSSIDEVLKSNTVTRKRGSRK